MKKVIGYIRVSDRKQVENGVSLDLQKKMIHQYCELNHLYLERIYSDEGISGKSTQNRLGYQQVMERVENKEVDSVVVYSITRFGRNLYDTISSVRVMTDKDITFLSVKENINTKTPEGRLQLNIYSSVSEYEREEIVGRIKSSLQHKKENGEKFCHSVFGLKVVNGKFVKDDKQMKIRRRIKLLYNKGYSMSKISRMFNEENIPTDRGGNWHHSTISNILKTDINEYVAS